MEIVNLTPHSIKLGKTTVKQGGNPIRVYQNTSTLFAISGIPVKLISKASPDLKELPEVREETLYIVSRLVADVYKGLRDDFVFPFDFVRSSSGRIVGCHSLAKFEA